MTKNHLFFHQWYSLRLSSENPLKVIAIHQKCYLLIDTEGAVFKQKLVCE